MVGAPSASQSPAWHAAAEGLLGSLDPAIALQLASYRDLVLSWNKRFNLTALRTAEEVDFRLTLESMRLVACIRDNVEEPIAGLTIVDIGSGAGIPGIPISILFPNVEVTMVEATGKKARFIEEAIAQLLLPNARVAHCRAEDLAREPGRREAFDVVVARAVGPLFTLLELSMPFLKTGGKGLFTKGELDESELTQAKSASAALGAIISRIITLPEIAGCPITQVVVAAKIDPIPARYPRRACSPAREPLKG